MVSDTQQIPAGYKQTDVGVIPEDWEVSSLINLVENETVSSGIYIDKKLYGTGSKIIKISDVFRDDYFESEKAQRAVLTHTQMQSKKAKEKDIFIALASVKLEGVGKVMLVKELDEETAFDHNVALIRSNNVLNANYLFLYLKSRYIRNQVGMLATQVGTTFLKSSSIKKFQIAHPASKKEQIEIFDAIDNIDSLLSRLDQLIQKKKNIKQRAMQELLTGKRRLPGFSKEWKEKRLGDIANVVGGGTPSSAIPRYWNGTINWFTPTEVGYSKYLNESCRKISEEGQKNSSAKLLPPSTILLTSRAGIGDVGILKSYACTNQGFQSLIPSKTCDSEFLYYLLQTKKTVLLEKANGSTFLEISPNSVRSIEVEIPETEEQIAIAQVLSEIDIKIELLDKQKLKYQSIKQGMMQQLLTGKIRLI